MKTISKLTLFIIFMLAMSGILNVVKAQGIQLVGSAKATDTNKVKAYTTNFDGKVKFADGSYITDYAKKSDTGSVLATISALDSVAFAGMHPIFNPNDWSKVRDHRILFTFPPSETMSAYGASAARIANSDSIIVIIKGDETDIDYMYLSTDNGDNFVFYDTLINRVTKSWHGYQTQEGLPLYSNDTIKVLFKGSNKIGDWVIRGIGMAYIKRSNLAVYEVDTPVISKTRVQEDIRAITGDPTWVMYDLGVSDYFEYNDSSYAIATIADSPNVQYQVYLMSGTDIYNLHVRAKIFSSNHPYEDDYAGSICRLEDSLWYMNHTQGDTANNGAGWHIDTKWSRDLYHWYDLGGRFLNLYSNNPDTNWESRRVYGARLLKSHTTNWTAPDTAGGYAQFYYSGSYVNQNVERSGKIKLYMYQNNEDSMVSFNDTMLTIASRYRVQKVADSITTYVSGGYLKQGGDTRATNDTVGTLTAAKDVIFISGGNYAGKIDNATSSWDLGNTSLAGSEFAIRGTAPGLSILNYTQVTSATSTLCPITLYNYISGGFQVGIRLSPKYIGSGTNRLSSLTISTASATKTTDVLTLSTNMSQIIAPLMVYQTLQDPKTFSPAAKGIDVNTTLSTNADKGIAITNTGGATYSFPFYVNSTGGTIGSYYGWGVNGTTTASMGWNNTGKYIGIRSWYYSSNNDAFYLDSLGGFRFQDAANANLALLITKAGKVSIPSGTNKAHGTATLSSGTVTVNTTAVTANSNIYVTTQSCSSCGYIYVSAKTAGTSFTITSSNGSDASTVAWLIIDTQ